MKHSVNIQDKWYQKYSLDESFDKPNGRAKQNLPKYQLGEEVSFVDAVAWVQGAQGNLDIRPKHFDKHAKKWRLCDTGSMVTVIQKSPHDKIDPTRSLQAVNGTVIKCYGQKEIDIQIGRKNYRILATIADIDQDILGFDFSQSTN